MQKILTILLENESGSLSRVVGLFSQRGYNIESLNVAPTNDPTLSLITIQTIDNKKTIEQIEKQLHKLIDVLRVVNIDQKNYIQREILLIKLKIKSQSKKDVHQIIKVFEGNIIYITITFFIVQLTGTATKINSFIEIVKNLSEIIEMSRSGVVGISCN
ncbi:acetolactate synthase small subunit [Buchnera aphidicola (Nipponaphis monzeni)]|uniref:Acetolactate synthase small subunit n=1 Tax=Buchnera aphidicola (Nipponaphis monzeni) TaxID=2495405 RepID=A0A455TA33_9GAMM|nr:acetolactate synthase small subunit [Buchnera aphidicola]BBI01191.1 acetolactate synthase small subunit [Buchnera aphidicola (Nipponaphis monzeni)]